MSWGGTPQSKSLTHDGRAAGIDNLFMAGQWLMPPGGLPAAVTGKWAIQRILKQEKREYRGL
jgi:phytoene dehydrogenase-like protein